MLPPREAQEILTRYFGSARLRTGRAAGCEAGVNANSPLALNRERTELIELFGWTPNQYGTAYGFDKLHKRGLRGEKMRVALMETDGFKRSDVETFARCFGAKVPPISQTPIDMKQMPAPGDETTLDLSVLVGLAPRLGAIDIYASPSDEASLLKSAVAALRPGRAKPDVISISLGICEPLVGGNVVSVRAMSDVFAVAAGAGIGVFASSGDQGEAGCSSDDAPTFVPAVSLPAALPFVTAVGGTNLTLDGANRIVDETVWNDTPLGGVTGGGGGLSIMIDRPWYQQPLGRTTSGPRGITRVVPDVSALADELPGYALYCTAEGCDNGWMTVGGTSAAAPLTAVGALLMTQEARRHGQQPVGFVNPLLYALAASGKRATHPARRRQREQRRQRRGPERCRRRRADRPVPRQKRLRPGQRLGLAEAVGLLESGAEGGCQSADDRRLTGLALAQGHSEERARRAERPTPIAGKRWRSASSPAS